MIKRKQAGLGQNQCNNGHRLVKIDCRPQHYSGWICDECRSHLPQLTRGVMHCPKCQYDRCPSCQKKCAASSRPRIPSSPSSPAVGVRSRKNFEEGAAARELPKAWFSEDYNYFRTLCKAAESEMTSLTALATLTSLLGEKSSELIC